MTAIETTTPPEFILPHRVTRKLLRSRWGRRARTVLVAATGCERLVRNLNRSGVDALGIDDDQAAAASGNPKVHPGNAAGGFPIPQHSLDLVLVGPRRSFRNGLNAPEPLIATANLLSSLKSRCRLVWLDATGDESIERNLAVFPGEVTRHDYHDGWERFLSLQWLLGRHRHVELSLITLTVPKAPISRLNWHQHARDAALAQTRAA